MKYTRYAYSPFMREWASKLRIRNREVAQRLWGDLVGTIEDPEHEVVWWGQGLADIIARFHAIDHFFVDAGVMAFAKETVKYVSREFFNFPCTPGGIGFSAEYRGIPVRVDTALLLHFPEGGEFKASVLVLKGVVYAGRPVVDILLGLDGKVLLGRFPSNELSPQPTAMEESIRMVMGFSLYCQAFPDMVRPMRSGEVTQRALYSGRHHRIEAHRVVRDEASSAKSPHFRRGHFRVLDAPCFNKKRGQVVFVKGAFIRGKAYEVLTEESE